MYQRSPRARICKRLRSPGRFRGIDSASLAWPVKQIGLSYQLHQAANQFLGSLKRFTNTGSAEMGGAKRSYLRSLLLSL
jgi:hypothetical protein